MKNFNAACYSQWLSERKIIAVVMLSVLVSCSSPLYTPSKENVPSTANIETLKKGRQLYVNKCGSCHNLRLPEKFGRESWILSLDKMQPKAKITDEEKNMILYYLLKGNK